MSLGTDPNSRLSSTFAACNFARSTRPRLRPDRLMCRFSIDIADCSFERPFVRRLLRTACFNPLAIPRADRLKIPDGRSMAFDVS